MNSMKTKQLQLLILFVVTFFFVGKNAPAVYAEQQTLRVSPVIINIDLSPGKTSSHDATIENLTNSPIPLRASLNDFLTSGEEGGYIFEDSKENPLLSWITLSESNFILNPREKKKIHLVIKTPQTIPVGGYYGILFFEPVLQNTATAATQISSKIGILMLANIGIQDPNAKQTEILAFTPSQISQDGTVPFVLRVKNIALNFFTAKPILTVSPLLSFSNSTKPQYLEEKIIFPGKVRRWTQDTTIQNLSPNIYKAHLIVSTGNGQSESQDQYFIVFPYMQVLLLLSIVIIVLFLFAKRKRLKATLTALLSN